MELPGFIKSAKNYIKRQYARLKSFITGKPMPDNDNTPITQPHTDHMVATSNSTTPDITIDIKPVEPLEAGKPCRLEITLYDRNTGQRIPSEELDIVHTKKLHLLVIDKSLSDYHHIHPKATDKLGVYSCEFTPETPYDYNAWADFTLSQNHKNIILKHEISGKVKAPLNNEVAVNKLTIDGVTVEWSVEKPLQANRDAMLKLKFTDAVTGKPVGNLEPILGAFAHLVGFSADGENFIHAHPIEDGKEKEGALQFHLQPEKAGQAKFFLQINRGGKEITFAIPQQINEPQKMAERIASKPATQHHHYL